jgi:hypothetical protein
MTASRNNTEEIWASRSHPVIEDMRFQCTTWRVQRWGWVAIGVVIIMALLGTFANGPLSSTSSADRSARLRVEYERLQRHGATANMIVRVAAAQPHLALHLNADFTQAFRIDALNPKPVSEHSREGGVEMVFHAVHGEMSTIYFALRPRVVGLVKGEIAIVGEAPARITQIVLP